MIHTILIGAHALAGGLALITGCLAIRHERAMPVYLGSVSGLLAFLAGALALDWSSQAAAARVTFAALTLLAGYVLWRAVRAAAARRPGTGQQSPQFLDHLGFTLIALLVGFVAIAVLDLGAPVWLVVLAALAAVAAGRLILHRVKARESQRPAGSRNGRGQRSAAHRSAAPDRSR